MRAIDPKVERNDVGATVKARLNPPGEGQNLGSASGKKPGASVFSLGQRRPRDLRFLRGPVLSRPCRRACRFLCLGTSARVGPSSA